MNEEYDKREEKIFEIQRILRIDCKISPYRIGYTYLTDIIYQVLEENKIEKITFYLAQLSRKYQVSQMSISRALDNAVRVEGETIFSKSTKKFLIDFKNFYKEKVKNGNYKRK